MRNILLIAGPVTDPNRFMAELGCHPDIAALPPVTLGNTLHAVARRAVSAAAGGARSGDALLTLAREEGSAALTSYFTTLRSSTGKSAIVLHDPSGPMFPFLNPPDIDLLVLTRTAESAAQAVGAGTIARVVEAAHKALESFDRRVAGFGVGAERVHTVDEDALRRDPHALWPQICRSIGVDAGPDAIEAMARPAVSPWSLRSGRF